MNDEPKRTQIPYEGGSGRTPTGAMQFANDWPGLFIRGDNSVPIMLAIRRLQERCGNFEDAEIRSSLRVLADIADIIERDVIVRNQD